jgi:glycosyltransferase involved in cell wall biosynthesis
MSLSPGWGTQNGSPRRPVRSAVVRVLLDTTYARRAPQSGTGIYLDRLADALSRLGGVEVLARPNPRRGAPAGGGFGSVRNLLSDRRWTGAQLPRMARELKADIIHHPLPAVSRSRLTPQVITVLDLAFERLPDQFDRGFRTYAHLAHRSAARRAEAVICISETTSADVQELWRVPAERIVVAPLGPGQELPAVAPRDATHFLYVGDAEPRKNLGTLLKAYELYRRRSSAPLELVLAGSAVAEGAGVRVERAPAPPRLATLYASAAALVHPSLYEGFGITPLEAMRAGAPVIAAPSVEEVCGDAARYADARDPASFAEAMLELAADPALRQELGERGRKRSARFSWDACAHAHLEAYSLAQSATG